MPKKFDANKACHMPKKFDANKACQPLYTAISNVISPLSKSETKDVLECLHGNIEGQLEAIEQEMEDEES
jgi:hypothetical protein